MNWPNVAAEEMARAAYTYLEEAAAHELANNVSAVLMLDAETTPEAAVTEMLVHRIRSFGLKCGEVESTARVMGSAWRRFVGRYVAIEEAA